MGRRRSESLAGDSAISPTPDEVIREIRCSCGGSSWSRSGFKTRYLEWTCRICKEGRFRLSDDPLLRLRFPDVAEEGEPLDAFPRVKSAFETQIRGGHPVGPMV